MKRSHVLSLSNVCLLAVAIPFALSSAAGCESKPKPAAKTAPAPAAPAPATPMAAKPATPTPVAAVPPKPATPPPVKPAPVPVKKEIEFDPRKPPAGYANCHRNHCHKVGGGVASYKQVMAEMGATKLVGVPKRAPMPKAPADVQGPPSNAVVTDSGMASTVLNAGDGTTKPGPTSVVTVHYTGWTTDGKAFDSSVSRGRPATFPLNRVIAGWTEGLQLMSVGEERRFWIPQHLAYKGQAGKPAGMLVFDVELLSIK